jgi:Trypsin-co-occurring domain 2
MDTPGAVMAEDVWVGLADAVQGLRRELLAAMAAGADEMLRFELGPVEIEFAVTVRRDGRGSAGVNFAVVTAGLEGGLSSDSVHRLKLTLNPKDVETGRSAEVAGWVDEIPPR